jgi:rod shape-determining protein MreD
MTALLAFTSLLLQSTVLPETLPAYCVPNFMLMVIVFLGFFEVSIMGVFLSFTVGLVFDLFSGTLLGPWAGSFVFVYAVLAIFAQRLFVLSGATIVLSVFVAGLVTNLLYLGLLYQFQPIARSLFPLSMVTSLVSAISAPVLFPLFRLLYGDSVEKMSSGRRTAPIMARAGNDR